jgi:hypothetical protein
MKKIPLYLPVIGPFYYWLYYKKRWGEIYSEDDVIKDEKELILFSYHSWIFITLFLLYHM